MALARYQAFAQDAAGNTLASPSVEVRRESDNAIALLFSDRAGTVAIANPFIGASDGYFGFHVAGGAYKITVTQGAVSRVFRYVAVGLAAESDTLGGGGTAATVSFTPAGNISATDVQAALQELDAEKVTPAAVIALIREKLTADRIYYVRTDGNDSNDGLTNTPGGAFLTIQKALTVISALDFNQRNVTIQLADGTYSTGGLIVGGNPGMIAATQLKIQGNATTPANVVVQGSVYCFQCGQRGQCYVKDMKLQGAALALNCDGAGSFMYFGNIDFGATAAGGVHVYCNRQGYLECIGNYKISGGAGNHIQASHQANIRYAQVSVGTITVAANVTFSAAFAYSSSLSDITFTGYSGSPFSLGAFTVTGVRYNVEMNSFIQQLVGVNFFPGSAAGTTATGGLYI